MSVGCRLACASQLHTLKARCALGGVGAACLHVKLVSSPSYKMTISCLNVCTKKKSQEKSERNGKTTTINEQTRKTDRQKKHQKKNVLRNANLAFFNPLPPLVVVGETFRRLTSKMALAGREEGGRDTIQSMLEPVQAMVMARRGWYTQLGNG